MRRERQPSPFQWELSPGETVLWQGKPEKWPFVTMGPLNMMFVVPFSLAWGGFFLFLEALAIQARSILGILGLAPFALFGLYLIGGRFWAGVRCWENTFYVVSNKRVLLRLGTLWPKVTSLPLSQISSIRIQGRRRGIGHINFNCGERHVINSGYAFQPGPSYGTFKGAYVPVPSFRYIREPERVYELIESLRKGLESG
jgi:hypothetical protein